MRLLAAAALVAVALGSAGASAMPERDTTPPRTVATVLAAGPGHARVALAATDAGSGVRVIEYLIEGTFRGGIYERPFVVRRGRRILFAATDRAQNVEATKEVRAVPGARTRPMRLTAEQRRWIAEGNASAKVRAAVPALEAYAADHGGYEGVTIAALHAYDTAIRGVAILSASRETYCIRGTDDGVSMYKNGPAGEITRRPCR